MQVLKWCQKRLKWPRFKDPTMKLGYRNYIRNFDSQMFFGFGVLLLTIASLDTLLAIIGREHRSKAVLTLQVVLPFVALLMRRLSLIVSKIILSASLLLTIFFLLRDFKHFYADRLPEQYAYIGNFIGIIEVIMISNVQNLLHKVVLGLLALMLKLLIASEGFVHTRKNLIGITVITFAMLISFVYQEIVNRRSYKAVYQAQERFKKFESLLSDDFPISVLIVSQDFQKILYSNSLFKEYFQADKESSRTLERFFHKFELDIEPATIGLLGPTCNVYLNDFVESLSGNKLGLQDRNLIVLPAIYKAERVNQTHYYEVKVRKTVWDAEQCYTVLFNDISERHMLSVLKLADEQKDRVIATVSHELRTPINGTLGLLEMISQRTTDDEDCQRYLKYCKSCNKLLLYLVNSILDLSQLRNKSLRINKENFVLNDLLEELKSLYIFQCQDKGIEFVIEKGRGIPREIYADRHRLIEILINLVSNAVKFTFRGAVTLKIEIGDHDSERLRFSVVDTGIGIKDQDKPRLFQMFGKVQHEDKNINIHGVGLGLTIVKDLVVAINDGNLNEKICFESEYGQGTVFSFRVKYKQDRIISLMTMTESNEDKSFTSYSFQECQESQDLPSHNMVTHETLENISPLSQVKPLLMHKIAKRMSDKDVELKNVLIVDDNPLNILAASFIFQKLDCKVGKAFNGQECIKELERCRRENVHYDLVLMDIQMPVLDGPQASKIIDERIKAGELDDVPIIALTAKQSTKEEKSYYRSCGIKAVLEKPLNKEKLMETIRTIVN